jgi:hypothetical protein
VETLHSILLGPYKYFLRKLLDRLTKKQKEEYKPFWVHLIFLALRLSWTLNFSGTTNHLWDEILRQLLNVDCLFSVTTIPHKKRVFG